MTNSILFCVSLLVVYIIIAMAALVALCLWWFENKTLDGRRSARKWVWLGAVFWPVTFLWFSCYFSFLLFFAAVIRPIKFRTVRFVCNFIINHPRLFSRAYRESTYNFFYKSFYENHHNCEVVNLPPLKADKE